ncbi:hypothetical protein LY78DRAFT_679968 [Colletotrichum sublineola]|nr:hypothetical protein LY78DRAFT_679968 [Colletotrichum sublineola]
MLVFKISVYLQLLVASVLAGAIDNHNNDNVEWSREVGVREARSGGSEDVSLPVAEKVGQRDHDGSESIPVSTMATLSPDIDRDHRWSAVKPSTISEPPNKPPFSSPEMKVESDDEYVESSLLTDIPTRHGAGSATDVMVVTGNQLESR